MDCSAPYQARFAQSPPQPPILLFLQQQIGAQCLGFFLGDMLGVVGDAGGAVIVRHGGQAVRRDRPERLDDGVHHVDHVRDVGLVQLAAIAVVDPALVPAHAGGMQHVVAGDGAGRLDLGQHFGLAAESGIDDLVAALRRIGIEGVLAQGLADDTAPALEIDVCSGGHGMPAETGHGSAGNTGGDAGITEQRHEGTAVHVAVAHALAQAFVTLRRTDFHL